MDGKVLSTDAEYEELFRYASKLPSCCEAGPVLKFARWLSVNQCWKYYRSEVFFLRDVLLENSTGLANELAQQETTAMFDADLVGTVASSKQGLLARTPGYLTEELVNHMDMFLLATGKLESEYKFRTTQLKSLVDGVEFGIYLAKGGYQDEFTGAVALTFEDSVALRRCGCSPDKPRGVQNATDLFSFTVQLLTERAIRSMPGILQYPQLAILLLRDDSTERRVARNRLRADFYDLLAREREVAEGLDLECKLVSDDITWCEQDIVRLFFNVVDSEHHLDDAPQSTHLARAMRVRFCDEKGPEDVHQHCRDVQRQRRHKNIGMAEVMNAQLNSGVLEARGVTCVEVDRWDLAKRAWQSAVGKEKSKLGFQALPKDWLKTFDGILNPRREWPSPTVVGQVNSFVAWNWLCFFSDELLAKGVSSVASWVSRLVPQHHLLLQLDGDLASIPSFSCKWDRDELDAPWRLQVFFLGGG